MEASVWFRRNFKRLRRSILNIVLGVRSPSKELMKAYMETYREFDWDQVEFDYRMMRAKRSFDALAAGEFGWEIYMMDILDAMWYKPLIKRKMRPLDYYCNK